MLCTSSPHCHLVAPRQASHIPSCRWILARRTLPSWPRAVSLGAPGQVLRMQLRWFPASNASDYTASCSIRYWKYSVCPHIALHPAGCALVRWSPAREVLACCRCMQLPGRLLQDGSRERLGRAGGCCRLSRHSRQKTLCAAAWLNTHCSALAAAHRL